MKSHPFYLPSWKFVRFILLSVILVAVSVGTFITIALHLVIKPIRFEVGNLRSPGNTVGSIS